MASEPTPPLPQIPVVPPDVPRAYANFVMVQPGGMDVNITFGHQVGAEPPAWSVRVAMSWEEAKFFAQALQGHVAGYEGQFGEIRDVMKTAQEAFAKAQAAHAEGTEDDTNA